MKKENNENKKKPNKGFLHMDTSRPLKYKLRIKKLTTKKPKRQVYMPETGPTSGRNVINNRTESNRTTRRLRIQAA